MTLGFVAFAVLAGCVVGSAAFVVRATNLVHAVLWLGVTLAGTAALYAMLGASFLAATQVLLYVGGVVTLMVFGVMLTRRHDGVASPAGHTSPGRGALAAAALFGVLAAAIGKSSLPAVEAAPVPPAALGAGLVTTHLLAFELLSFLLLGAIVGAIVIARRRDPGAPATSDPRRPRRGALEPATTVATGERP